MIAVALKGLLGRKTRAILTALAIVLGTGMVSATFIFTDTLNQAFNGVFSKPYEQTSVVVVGEADRDRSGEHARACPPHWSPASRPCPESRPPPVASSSRRSSSWERTARRSATADRSSASASTRPTSASPRSP